MEKVSVERTAWVFDKKEREKLVILLTEARQRLCDGDSTYITTGAINNYIKTADHMIAQLEQDDKESTYG